MWHSVKIAFIIRQFHDPSVMYLSFFHFRVFCFLKIFEVCGVSSFICPGFRLSW